MHLSVQKAKYNPPQRKTICPRSSKLGTYILTDPVAICLTCKHYRPQQIPSGGYCTHPASTTVDIITGEFMFDSANLMRKDSTRCGIQARYFQKENDFLIAIRKSEDLQKLTHDIKHIAHFLVRFVIMFVCFFGMFLP